VLQRPSMADTKRDFLRHALATLVYRGSKSLRDAPPEVAAAAIAGENRTPLKILSHINDLLDWAWSMAHRRAGSGTIRRRIVDGGMRSLSHRGEEIRTTSSPPTPSSPCPVENLFPGTDRRRHRGTAGSWRWLRRHQAGRPDQGARTTIKADIVAGRVGPEQTKREVRGSDGARPSRPQSPGVLATATDW